MLKTKILFKMKTKILFKINFWGCTVLKAEEKSANEIRAWDCGSSKCLQTPYPKRTAWHLQHWFLHCMHTLVDSSWTAERMNDFTIFCRVFITSDVSATGLQDRNNSGYIAETGYKILAYGSLAEGSKNAAELISIKCQCSVINTTRTRTLIQINPFQEHVHNNFLNFSVSFRQQRLF